MELRLSTEEQELLHEVLEHRLHELQNEIVHTDHRDFKTALRADEKRIESLLSRLQMGVGAKAS